MEYNLNLTSILQNSDIVLLLESAYANVEMPLEKRFYYQAPMIKKYTDAIATECPKAFIIVCATPVDCMVPLIAEVILIVLVIFEQHYLLAHPHHQHPPAIFPLLRLDVITHTTKGFGNY